MDDLKRARKLGQYDRERVKGEQAKQTLKTLEPHFAELEQELRMELVTRTRADGKVYEANVWRLVALDDLATRLDRTITGGRIAEQRANKLINDVGGDT